MDEAKDDNQRLNATPTSRRGFIKKTLAAAAVLSLADSLPFVAAADDPTPGAKGRKSASSPPESPVVRISSDRILPVRVVQRSLLKDSISQGMMLLTGTHDVRDAWHAVLKPEDKILIKFNQSGAPMIGTSQPFAEVLLKMLLEAGWPPEQILMLEAEVSDYNLPATRKVDMRWQGRVVDFGKSGKDVFLACLDEATAIINVPFLKTHHLATTTGCLKNLSHGLIRHPARFHADGCDPAIAEIVASEPIRSKLRLNICNALRAVFRKGPDAGEDDIHNAGTILLARDPVACDAVGYGLLNEIRSLRGLSPLLPGARIPRQLATATRLGLGQSDIDQIAMQTLAF